MRNFQGTFETGNCSFISSFSICITVPLSISFQHYPFLMRVEDMNYVAKETCLVYDSISTATAFTTEVCQETFKI